MRYFFRSFKVCRLMDWTLLNKTPLLKFKLKLLHNIQARSLLSMKLLTKARLVFVVAFRVSQEQTGSSSSMLVLVPSI